MGKMNTLGVRSGNCGNLSGEEKKKPKSESQREKKEICLKSAERKNGILTEKGEMVNKTVTDRKHGTRPVDVSVVGQALVDHHTNGKERTVEKRVTRTRPTPRARTLGGHPIRSNHYPDMDITKQTPMCAVGVSSSVNRTVRKNRKSRNTKGTKVCDTVSRAYRRTSDIEESKRSTPFFLTQDESLGDLYEFEEKGGEFKENNLGDLMTTSKNRHLGMSNQSIQLKRVRSAKLKPQGSEPVTPFKATNGYNPPLDIANKYGNNESKPRENLGIRSKRQKESLIIAERRGKLREPGPGTNSENKTPDTATDKPSVGSVKGEPRKYTITLSLPTVDISEESESSVSSSVTIEMSPSSNNFIASDLAFCVESGTSSRLRPASISATVNSAKSIPKAIDLTVSNPYQGIENENPDIKFRKRFGEPIRKNEGPDRTNTNSCDDGILASQSSIFRGIIEMLAPRKQRKKKTNFNAHCNTSNTRKSDQTNRKSVPKLCVKSHKISKPKSIQQLVHEARGTIPSELHDGTRVRISDKSHEIGNRQVSGKKREQRRKKRAGLRLRKLSKEDCEQI